MNYRELVECLNELGVRENAPVVLETPCLCGCDEHPTQRRLKTLFYASHQMGSLYLIGGEE